MGKRKLRFDQRKNYERKRRINRCITIEPVLDSSSMTVSLPLSIFTASSTSSLSILSSRLKATGKLFEGWNISSTVTAENMCTGLSLSKCFTQNCLFNVMIDANFKWSLFIASHLISVDTSDICKEFPSCVNTVMQC